MDILGLLRVIMVENLKVCKLLDNYGFNLLIMVLKYRQTT
jgi:hypothetical protein